MVQQSPAALPGSENILRCVLPNGITVLVHENHTSPTVVVSGYLYVGSQDEDPEKRGLANFTVDVMERGTTNRSFEQLYEEVESIGASFGFNSGTHTTYFGAKSLSDHLTLMLDIIRDVICFPLFLPTQVEKVRVELLTGIEERANDTRRMATRTFYELAYPASHPYHWSQIGYTDTLAAIKLPDLTTFHKSQVTPENMVMVIVGDVDAQQVVSTVTELFSAWNHAAVKRPGFPVVPSLDTRLTRSIVIEDKVQTNIVMGWPGPARKHPDFLSCFLANTVLGVFGMYGRLGKRVREENSLAYFAYSSISGGLGPGPWRINTGVDPDNIDKVLSIIQEEIKRMVEEPIPDDELEDSIAYLTGSLPMHLETNEGLAQSIINIERHKLGLNYLRQYRQSIMQISPSDIINAVQNWIDPDNIAISVAGPTLYS